MSRLSIDSLVGWLNAMGGSGIVWLVINIVALVAVILWRWRDSRRR